MSSKPPSRLAYWTGKTSPDWTSEPILTLVVKVYGCLRTSWLVGMDQVTVVLPPTVANAGTNGGLKLFGVILEERTIPAALGILICV